MPEKATLLTSIPPVAKAEPAKKTSLLTPIGENKIDSSKPILQPLNNQKTVVAHTSKQPEVAPKVKPLVPIEVSPPQAEAKEVSAVAVVDSASAKDPASSGGTSPVVFILAGLVVVLVVIVVVVLRKSKGGAPKNTVIGGRGTVVGAASKKNGANGNATPQTDPIIDFLNQEAATEEAKPAVAKPQPTPQPAATPAPKPSTPKPQPVAEKSTQNSKKPAPQPRPSAPKKPSTSKNRIPQAPNAPSEIKAPAKPKKRF